MIQALVFILFLFCLVALDVLSTMFFKGHMLFNDVTLYVFLCCSTCLGSGNLCVQMLSHVFVFVLYLCATNMTSKFP